MNSAQLDRVLMRLDHVRTSGDGYAALCPAHDDRTASLSVKDGDTGVVLKCHTGCSYEAIIGALGLTTPELKYNETTPHRSAVDVVYPYHDADGRLAYEKVRYYRNGKKDFAFRARDGSKRRGAPAVLYHLPQVLAAAESGGRVALMEGEKDCDRVQSATGLTTTTIDVGAGPGKFKVKDADCLVGAQVAILFDNDPVGVAFARECHALIPSSRIVPLPGVLPEGGDVSDWLDQGHTAAELTALIDAAFQGPDTPLPLQPCELAPPAPVAPAATERHLVTRTLAQVTLEAVDWAWPGWIAYGAVSLFEGDPGLGKSLVTTYVAAVQTVGGQLPDGTTLEADDVVILSFEDSAEHTIKARVLAAGGDPTRIHVVDGVRSTSGHLDVFSVPDDVELLRATVARTGARLVIIDPIAAALTAAIDSHRDASVRRALAPLAQLARETGAAVVVVRHLVKSGGRRAINAGGGSVAFGGAARAVAVLGEHPEDATRRILASVKCNLAVMPPSIELAIVNTEVTCDGITVEAPVIAWRGPSTITANQIQEARAEEPDSALHSKIAACVAMLPEWLSSGPLPADEVRTLGKREGFNERLLQRAAPRAGVVIERADIGKAHHSVWKLGPRAHLSRDRQP